MRALVVVMLLNTACLMTRNGIFMTVAVVNGPVPESPLSVLLPGLFLLPIFMTKCLGMSSPTAEPEPLVFVQAVCLERGHRHKRGK